MSDHVTENLYSFSVEKADGTSQSLEAFKGKPVLIVNVASKCGFTPQYDGLEQLYKDYHAQGFEILGFPCNQFGAQEPGSDDEIQSFCQLNYGVSFPIMKKIDVNGASAHPLYQWLKTNAPGLLGTEAVKWNFTKFLVDKNGQVLARYAPQTKPQDLKTEIEKAL